MASLKDISMSELAKGGKGLGIVKAGVSKKQDGEWVDPYGLDNTLPTEITGEEIGNWPDGKYYVQLSLAIINADGTTKKAGNTRLDLPVVVEGMSAEDEAGFLPKAGEKFLRFLRAVDPERFNVFASIDKSDPTKWVYLDYAGNATTEKARLARADEIDDAVMTVANGLIDGSVTLAGSQCFVTKRASNNPKRPFVNFSATDSTAS